MNDNTMSQTTVIPRKKKVLFLCIYITLLIVVGIGGLELVARYFFKIYIGGRYGSEWVYDHRRGLKGQQQYSGQTCRGYYPAPDMVNSELVYDAQIGWRARRGYSATICHSAYPTPIGVQTNADGFRDEDWDVKLQSAARSGASKVLLIGDSVLYGLASEATERLSEQLAAVYALEGKPVAVFNAGIPGYGASQQYRLLPELMDRIHPDVVILIFWENDYGDTALPYDHRHPLRVYKPFYDENGEILFNQHVPKRPSLLMQGPMLSRFYFRFVLDLIYFFIQDIQYSAYDIPNNRNAPYPIQYYDSFIFETWLQERFPYVERTVMTLYKKMDQLATEHNARFFVASSRQYVHYVIAEKLKELGIAFIPAPFEEKHYWHWEQALYDGHPNFLWAWFMANKIYESLEQKVYQPDLHQLPQLAHVPIRIDFSNDASSARYLYGNWLPSEQTGRWLGKEGDILLRHPAPSSTRVLLEVTGFGNGEQVVNIIDDRNRTLCQLHLITAQQTVTCLLDVAEQGQLLFLRLVPVNFRANQDQQTVSSAQRQSVFLEQLAVRPVPSRVTIETP